MAFLALVTQEPGAGPSLLQSGCVIPPTLIPNPRAWRGARCRGLGGRDEGHLSVRHRGWGGAPGQESRCVATLLFDYESSVKEGT